MSGESSAPFYRRARRVIAGLWKNSYRLAAAMPKFTFLKPSDVRLTPEHRAQYITVRQVIRWEVTDDTGEYSGLLILGEQIIGLHTPPRGFLPNASMTIDRDEREIPPDKIEELCRMVRTQFFDADVGVRVVFGNSSVH